MARDVMVGDYIWNTDMGGPDPSIVREMGGPDPGQSKTMLDYTIAVTRWLEAMGFRLEDGYVAEGDVVPASLEDTAYMIQAGWEGVNVNIGGDLYWACLTAYPVANREHGKGIPESDFATAVEARRRYDAGGEGGAVFAIVRDWDERFGIDELPAESIGAAGGTAETYTPEVLNQNFQRIQETLDQLRSAMGDYHQYDEVRSAYGYNSSPRAGMGSLMLPQESVLKERILRESAIYREWFEKNIETTDHYGYANYNGMLTQHLESKGFKDVLVGEGFKMPDIDYTVKMMLAAGASAAVFAITKSFPLGAAAYFGVQSLLQPSGVRELFAGFEGGEGSTWDGHTIDGPSMDLPEGIPNQIFAEYRFVCYDRLTQRWFPSDEIRPLAWDSSEDTWRWFCLDRQTGKVYHANKIRKARIWLD